MKIILLSNDHLRRTKLENQWKAAGIAILPSSSRMQPDFIILDLSQPGALGSISATKKHYPYIPLVAFGPLGQAGLFQQAKKVGADEVIPNPDIGDWLIQRRKDRD